MAVWRRNTLLIMLLLSLSWLTLGCQTVNEFVDSKPTKTWPSSTFVPLRETIEVNEGESLPLESRHISPVGLQKLEIFVNDEAVTPALSSDQGTMFSNEAGNIQILVNAPHDQANAVKPEFPENNEWVVSLIWIGYVPGSYELQLAVVDADNRTQPPITQRIEVKEVNP